MSPEHSAYIDAQDARWQDLLRETHSRIADRLPEAEQVMSYGIPVFSQGDVVIGIAAFKKHCGVYPFSGGVMAKLGDVAKGYEKTKAALKFLPEKPLSDEVLDAMIAARLGEISA